MSDRENQIKSIRVSKILLSEQILCVFESAVLKSVYEFDPLSSHPLQIALMLSPAAYRLRNIDKMGLTFLNLDVFTREFQSPQFRFRILFDVMQLDDGDTAEYGSSTREFIVQGLSLLEWNV